MIRQRTAAAVGATALVLAACSGGVSLGTTDGGAAPSGDASDEDASTSAADADADANGADASDGAVACDEAALTKCPYACNAATGEACSTAGVTCRSTPSGAASRHCTCTQGKWSCGPLPSPPPGCATDCAVDTSDPCTSETFPTCPRECTQFPELGACVNGDACRAQGSNIGDECTCTGGAWQCAPHPPLGMGCNAVCL
jgi:hypothetical protein